MTSKRELALLAVFTAIAYLAATVCSLMGEQFAAWTILVSAVWCHGETRTRIERNQRLRTEKILEDTVKVLAIYMPKEQA